MSYEPTNWQAGDTVTSAKLNKMEQGIANGGIRIVHEIDTGEINEMTEDPIIRLDITPNDLENMLNNGQLPILYDDNSDGYKVYAPLTIYMDKINSSQYICSFGDEMSTQWLSTDSNEYFLHQSQIK